LWPFFNVFVNFRETRKLFLVFENQFGITEMRTAGKVKSTNNVPKSPKSYFFYAIYRVLIHFTEKPNAVRPKTINSKDHLAEKNFNKRSFDRKVIYPKSRIMTEWNWVEGLLTIFF
jgi:hypothetical protein